MLLYVSTKLFNQVLHSYPQVKQQKKFVAGSSAERVCRCVKLTFLLLHFLQLNMLIIFLFGWR